MDVPLEDPLQNYLLIRWDEDGDLELDQGGINHYETIGILKACLRELEERNPPMHVRWAGMTNAGIDEDEEDSD